MGNEMGNNNTSELREEDNKTETEGKAAQEPLHSNGFKTPEIKDYHEKESELASDSEDHTKAAAHTNGKEQEGTTEVHLSVASPESELKLIKESDIDAEFQTTAPLPEGLEDCKNPKSSNFKESVSVMSKHRLENECSLKKEEEDMVNTSSIAIALTQDLECEDSAGDECEQVEASQSEQQSTNFPKGLEENSGLLDISEPSIAFNTKEKNHESDNLIADNSEVGFVPKLEFQEDLRPSDERFEVEVEVGNEDGQSDIVVAKIESKTDGEKNSSGTSSLESQAEADKDVDATVPEVKCIILTEETEPKPKESETGDIKHDDNESDSEVDNSTDSSKRANCNNYGKEDLIINVHSAASNGVLQAERMEETDKSCNHNEDSEDHCRGSKSKFTMHESLEAKQHIPNGNKNGEESGDCNPVSSDGTFALVPELVELTAKLPITNGTKSKKESEDFKSKGEKPEKERTSEVEEKTEAQPSFPASLLQPEDQLQITAMKFEDAQLGDDSTSEAKLESSSELLEAVASPLYATSTSMETSVPTVELPIEKLEEAEAVLIQATELPETLTETNSSASQVYKPRFPSFLLQPEDQQQKTGTKCEYTQVCDDSTSEVKLKSSSELLKAAAAPFHATSTSVETSVPAVELPIEKHEEAEAVLVHGTETPRMLTETDSSASENHSTKVCNGLIPENSIGKEMPKSAGSTTIEKTQVSQHSIGVMETVTYAKLSGSADESNEQSENVETSIPAGVGNEEQESAARFSIESIPDGYNARAEMRKSPSFGIDLRIEARSEESDQTPLLYQNKNTNQDDLSLQSSLLPIEHNRESLKYQPLPPEEKVITLERRDSDYAEKDKSASSSTPIPSKSKEKHKRRSSLFTNCICCTTVLN